MSKSKTNILAQARILKTVINYRVSDARENQEALTLAYEDMAAITGRKAKLAKAKKSVSTFKLRQNDPLALKVTLRGRYMQDFLTKLIALVLPRLRDFKGISVDNFDGQGNYNLTIKDQTYFPEINLDKVNKIRSVQISIVTSASSKDEAKMLLSSLGFPFIKTT